MSDRRNATEEIAYKEREISISMFNKLKRAQNPHTDYVTLRGMVNSRSWKIRAALAANPNLQNHLFDQLAVDKKTAVRSAMATNPNLTLKIWEVLAADTDSAVSEALLGSHPEKPQTKNRRA